MALLKLLEDAGDKSPGRGADAGIMIIRWGVITRCGLPLHRGLHVPSFAGQQTRFAQANKRHDAELLSQPTNHAATGEGKKSDAKF